MTDNALALIQAKIVEIEEKLAKLKVTEMELRKLSGTSVHRAMTPMAVKRSRARVSQETVAAEETENVETKKSVTARIRDFLSQNDLTSAAVIGENLGIETRPVSFALQALKRKGEVQMKDGVWSLKGRRRKIA